MTYKTILVHCEASKAASRRRDVAAGLAQRFASHLIGLYARSPREPPIYFDIGGGKEADDIIRSYEEDIKAGEAKASAAFEKALAGMHVSTGWLAVDGYLDAEFAVHALCADLVILGQSDQAEATTPSDLPQAVALATGKPVIVVPRAYAGKPPGKVVMLCWNGSREAARAASDAMPFLMEADRVVVLVVDPMASSSGSIVDRGGDVAAWLGRRVVKATIQRDAASEENIGAVIMSRAADNEADLIVMGVYGHSRIREWILGGASRALLGNTTVPLFMTH